MSSRNGWLLRPDHWSEKARAKRLEILSSKTGTAFSTLAAPLGDPEVYRGQIENLIGVVQVPVGIAGPLSVRGDLARGSFFVPLATTEGALVLSVSRGAEAISAAGGALVHASDPEVVRAPLFVFADGRRARQAARWIGEQFEPLRAEAEATTRHGRLLSVTPVLFGRRLILRFVYSTGDAAGQNLVTLATDAACRWLLARPPFDSVELHSLESNLSHDKKLAALAVSARRGRRVDAEVIIPRAIALSALRAPVDRIACVARDGIHASVISGAVGANAQFANVLAALFLATGQDVASIVECGSGLTIMEVTAEGDLYASVTIPNLTVGSVGGGTRLPSQHECLGALGCAGPGLAKKLAEIAGAAVLAGELSLVASLAAGTFAQAHAMFGRPVSREPQPAKVGER